MTGVMQFALGVVALSAWVLAASFIETSIGDGYRPIILIGYLGILVFFVAWMVA